MGEEVELKEGKFKVVEVNHQFSVSPLKHVVVVTVDLIPGLQMSTYSERISCSVQKNSLIGLGISMPIYAANTSIGEG